MIIPTRKTFRILGFMNILSSLLKITSINTVQEIFTKINKEFVTKQNPPLKETG